MTVPFTVYSMAASRNKPRNKTNDNKPWPNEVVGILICGSGIGISIAANRYSHIRAALCDNVELATLSREHNNANVLALGARFVEEKKALEISNMFLNSEFAVGRHSHRVSKLSL